MRLSWVLLLSFRACALLVFACALAAAAEPASRAQRSPVPDWVEWTEVPDAGEKVPGSDRVSLLIDDQLSLAGRAPVHFYRRVNLVTAVSGIKAAGDFSVEYDPSFEQVQLHAIDVVRDGRREDRVASARIDTLQREDGLEQGLLDGRLTLHIVLDDVRIGDTVDFAVSVHGENPALEGHYATRYWFAPATPTRLRSVRVLHPVQREMRTEAVGAGIETEERQRDGLVDRRWRLRELRPSNQEDREPSWWFDGARLQVGDAHDWADVVAWALPMYEFRTADAATVAAGIGLAADSADEAAVLRAIAFVQDEIRYTGLEFGSGAYRPHPPSLVAARRYGDCKDKALLLVGLLRHLGLEASPALVDADEREQIADRIPSPSAFDHVVVRFVFEGTEYWVDATSDYQRGRLAHFAQADFGRALLIAPGERVLRTMPDARPALPLVDIAEEIDLRERDGSLAEVGDYRIRTTYRHARADSARREFSGSSPESIGQGYVEAVAVYYPGVEQVEPPTMRDDPRRNEVEVVEHYRLPQLWQPSDGDPGKEADVWLSEVDRAFSLPKAVQRRAPYELGNFIDVRQKLTVQLDDDWPLHDEETVVDSEHVEYRGRAVNDGDTLVLEGRLRTRSRVVPAADVAKLRSDLERISESSGHELWVGEPGSGGIAAAFGELFDARLVGLFLLIAGFWGWVAWCGFSRGTSPWLGVLFRPRASVRAGIEGRRYPLAAVLVALGALLSAVLDADIASWYATAAWLKAVGATLAVLAGSALLVALQTALYDWVARLYGGTGSRAGVFVAVGWSQVPVIVASTVTTLALAMYGAGLLSASPPELAAPLGLLMLLVFFPALLWALLVWVASLAEAHTLSLRRALLVTLTPLLVLGVLLALLLGAFAAVRAAG